MDAFVDALVAIQAEAEQDPAKVKGAPYTLPVRRLDDVRAAKQLDLAYRAVSDAPSARCEAQQSLFVHAMIGPSSPGCAGCCSRS